MAERKTVKEIRKDAEKTQVSVTNTFAIYDKASSPVEYKNGYWFSLLVGDKTGKLLVKYWGGRDKQQVDQLFESLKRGQIVEVKGFASPDSYVNDIVLATNEGKGYVKPVELSDFSEFLPASGRDLALMLNELDDIRAGVKDEHLKKLLDAFFSDESKRKKFISAPGAIYYHHAYTGGLLEHILSVTKICGLICDTYPNLHRDLLITGALLHDIGKLCEYELNGAAFEYVREAKYIGHIQICERELSKLISTVEGFPSEYANELRHMILSHHGTPEMGSPIQPGFVEAEALHLADFLDSQINKFVTMTENFREMGEYNRELERKILRGNKH